MGPPADVSAARPGPTAPHPQHSGFPAPPGTSSRLGHYPPHIPPPSTLPTPSSYPHPPPGYSSSSGLPEGSPLRRQFASEEEIRAYYNRQENFLGEDMKHQIRQPYGVWNCMPVRTAASSHALAAGPGPAKQSRFAGPVVSSSCVSGSSSAASLHSSPAAVPAATGQHSSSSSQVSPAQPAKAGSSSSSSSSSSSTAMAAAAAAATGKTVATETSPSVPYVYQKDDLKLVINLRSTVAPLTPTETTSTTSSATNTPTTTTTTASNVASSSSAASASASASVSAQTVAEDVPAKPGKVKKACKDMTAQEIVDGVKGSGEEID